MVKKIFVLLFILIPINAHALIEVDITRGNLNPLPIAVSPLSIDENSRKNFEKILQKKNIGSEISIVVEKNLNETSDDLEEIELRIIKILDQKIRPAVAKDGGDIKFKEFKNGTVKVQLQGSCSGCPSSTMTLKQGVQNLLRHYIPEVKQVEAI